MRQLKGKVKETKRQKKERLEDNKNIQKQLKTVVLPIIGALFVLMVVYVFVKTRPIADDIGM